MTTTRRPRALIVLALVASFCAGMVFDGWLRTVVPPLLVRVVGAPAAPEAELSRAEPPLAAVPLAPVVVPLAPVLQPPAMVGVPPAAVAASPPLAPAEPMAGAVPSAPRGIEGASEAQTMAAVDLATIEALLAPRLRMPIDGIRIESFKGGFAQQRGERPHEAVDIMAPRGTPIHAVQDGTIAKLFFSKLGGVTVYEFEDDSWLCFYYAHLERYADDLKEGQHVSRGDVIGYVGSSGNAQPNAPHLHFAISELNQDRKWWQGRALDPYLVYRDRFDD